MRREGSHLGGKSQIEGKMGDKALSEIVSSLSLIIVLVIAAGAILSFVTSQYPKETIPYADIEIEENTSSGYTYFSHQGGENLSYGKISQINVFPGSGSGTPIPFDSSDLQIIVPGGTPVPWNLVSDLDFSYGSQLIVPGATTSNEYSYQLIYKGGGSGEYLYRQYGEGGSGINPIPTPISICIPGKCVINADNASFTLDDDNAPIYLLTSSACENCRHEWIVSGPGTVKTLTEKNPSVTLHPSTSDTVYTIQHIVTQTECEESVCSRSSSQPFTVSGCSDSCDPDFSYISNGMAATFSDKTEGSTSWYWDFGDGYYSDEVSPSHTYYGEKSYFVTLTVNKSLCGVTSRCPSVTKRIALGCSGDTSFSWEYQEPTTWDVEFKWVPDYYQYGTDYTVNWDYGDGIEDKISSDDWTNSITHSYTKCKDYSVTLSLYTKDCGSYSSTKTVNLPCFCSDNPFANFTIEKITVGTPFEIEITDLSAPGPVSGNRIISWLWDMGDGIVLNNTSSNKPDFFSYSYPRCGQYSVHLTVFDSQGCWDDTTREVSCGSGDSCTPGIPTADFSYEPDEENGKTILFTDESTPADSIERRQWDMGDGTRYTVSDPTHSYGSYGNYSVKLRVWDDDGCWDDTIRDISILCESPSVGFAVNTISSDSKEYSFTDTSTIPAGLTASYYWEFGDEDTSTSQNPTHSYDSCSQYTVRLTVTTNCGSYDSVIQDVICGCLSPIPDFDYSCIGEKKVNFTDLSRSTDSEISSWSWSFGDGVTSNDQNPIYEYENSGTYPVKLTITTECGSSASWTRQVTVPCCIMPTTSFSYSCNPDGKTVDFFDTSKTTGDTISKWEWDFGDGETSNDQNPSHIFSGEGTWLVKLTIITGCGASNTYSQSITIPCYCTPPVANFSTEIDTADPFVIKIMENSTPDDGSITLWSWSFGDGETYSGQTPPDHEYTSGCGEYLVSLTVTNDCGESDTYDVKVCCPVYANFSYRMDPLDGTAPLTVYFTDRTIGTPNSWGWTFGDGGVSSFRNPVYTYTQGGNYSATLHASSSCGGNESHSETIDVYCPPVEALFNYTIIDEDPLTIKFSDLSTGYDITEWHWYFDDGTSSTEQNPTHIYNVRDDYQVVLTIKNSCGSESQNTMYLPVGCLPLTIVATVHEGGSISPSGNVTVPCGCSQEFYITPDNCHTIREVIIDEGQPGEEFVITASNYTFLDVQYDHTIDAYFDLKQYEITSSADIGGTIDPLGITIVDCGANQSFNVTAGYCFNITDVIINSSEHLGPQVSPFTYTFTNVTSDQSIYAMFALKTFPIEATAGYGGNITPNGTVMVNCGYDQTFSITNLTCWNIANVLVDGISVGAIRSYSFTNVTVAHTISASFVPRGPFNITSSAYILGPDGTLTPLTPTSTYIWPPGVSNVECGGSLTYNMLSEYGTGNDRHILGQVYIDGIPGGVINPYTFTNVQSNHTIFIVYTPYCEEITGYIRDNTAHVGVGGVRIELWNQARTDMIRYTYSLSDGSYLLPAPVSQNLWFDVYCPNSLSNPAWTTIRSELWYDNQPDHIPSVGNWRNNVRINQGNFCRAHLDWYGNLG